MEIGTSGKTVVFCTSYVPKNGAKYYTWQWRYRIWLEAVRRSALIFDQIVLVDDGSELLPDWDDLTILEEGNSLRCDAPIVLFHHAKRLGRLSVSDFPGWVRSFFFMSRYAEINGFTKIVHLEADAFLITPRACKYVNTLDDGWTGFWCDRFKRPESGVQIITGSGLRLYKEWAMKPIDAFAGKVIEKTLPFTNINRGLRGDRYGEDKVNRIPRTADWCMQARPSELSTYQSYFWWMPWFANVFHEDGSKTVEPEIISTPSRKLTHEGIYYLSWLKEAAQLLMPQMYLEIGTHAGDSIKMIGCDAVCVDPNFIISSNVLMRRKNTHFFQGTSDEFFSDDAFVKRLFPQGIDLAFLDGLHLYEALLRDFFNTERNVSSDNSMIVMHDCLPLNNRMAHRLRRTGDETEPQRIRDFWTGDVWKVVVILNKYRPDIKISYLDCPPTGLVVCTQLDSSNEFLQKNYDNIVREFIDLDLAAYGIGKLWDLFATFKSSKVIENAAVFDKAFYPSISS